MKLLRKRLTGRRKRSRTEPHRVVITARYPDTQITRLARGLPAGSNIEYANRNILADAISGRQKM